MGARTRITREYPNTRVRDADMKAMLAHGWQIQGFSTNTVVYEGNPNQEAPRPPRPRQSNTRVVLILFGLIIALIVVTNNEPGETLPGSAPAAPIAIIEPSGTMTGTSSVGESRC